MLLLLGRYLKFQNKTEGLDFKSYVTTSRILTLDKPEPDVTDLWILDFDDTYIFFIKLLFLADIEIQSAIINSKKKSYQRLTEVEARNVT